MNAVSPEDRAKAHLAQRQHQLADQLATTRESEKQEAGQAAEPQDSIIDWIMAGGFDGQRHGLDVPQSGGFLKVKRIAAC